MCDKQSGQCGSCDPVDVSIKDCIYTRRCFMSGEYCSKQAQNQKEREQLHSVGEINVFVIMNFSNMSDVVYNWRLKPFIESLTQFLEISNDKIYCHANPKNEKKMTLKEIRESMKKEEKIPVQKINVVRADTNYASNYVVCNRVCQQMQIADLIIVDVSSENTNVFYEFGMAMALRKLILPICYNESFFKIQIPEKLKKYEEKHEGEKEEQEQCRKEMNRIKRHIDCYPWRRNLFEHYGIRYRSREDSKELNGEQERQEVQSGSKKKSDPAIGYYGSVRSTQYLGYDEAVNVDYGFSDIQYARFPYVESMPGESDCIGKQIYSRIATTYNKSRFEHNTLIVYTMDGFLNGPQAGQCIINFYKHITERMKIDGCFCGDRVGVLIQPNVIPEGVKDAKTKMHLTYGVGEIIQIGMNEATYVTQREIIKPLDFLKDTDYPEATEKQTEKDANPEKPEENNEIEPYEMDSILNFTKNYLRNKSISIYPNTPVYVKRVKDGVQKNLLDLTAADLEYYFCFYHLMLRTLAFTNELVVDISQNSLQSLFWLGAAHASSVDAIVVRHEASDQERTILTGSSEKQERPIFDVAGLWSAIFRSDDTDGFYRQLLLVQEGIEQHSKLMLRNLADYEEKIREFLYKNTVEKEIKKISSDKTDKEKQVLESYYRDRFWKPMLRYEHLRIYLPQVDGIDAKNMYPKLNAVKWDVDAIANLSHYLSQRTHVGQYSFRTLKKKTFDAPASHGNLIIVGNEARPLSNAKSEACSLPDYIQGKRNLQPAQMDTGENLIHSHIEIEKFTSVVQKQDNDQIYKENNQIYKGFVYGSSNVYHGWFSQVSHPGCYKCIQSQATQGTQKEENGPIISVKETDQGKGCSQTAGILWKECALRKQGITHLQLAQLVLWREVDTEQKKVWFWVSMIGASGPSTMALSTLLINEPLRKAAFDLDKPGETKPEAEIRWDGMKNPLSDLQKTIREKIIDRYKREFNEIVVTPANPDGKFRTRVRHAAVLYLSSVLYRHFLPFLSLEDEKKLNNGMRYFLTSLYASKTVSVCETEDEAQQNQANDPAVAILNNACKALENVLSSLRGVEAMYEVEVKITEENTSDSREMRSIRPLSKEHGSFVNCLFVEKDNAGNTQEKQSSCPILEEQSEKPDGTRTTASMIKGEVIKQARTKEWAENCKHTASQEAETGQEKEKTVRIVFQGEETTVSLSQNRNMAASASGRQS